MGSSEDVNHLKECSLQQSTNSYKSYRITFIQVLLSGIFALSFVFARFTSFIEMPYFLYSSFRILHPTIGICFYPYVFATTILIGFDLHLRILHLMSIRLLLYNIKPYKVI